MNQSKEKLKLVPENVETLFCLSPECIEVAGNPAAASTAVSNASH